MVCFPDIAETAFVQALTAAGITHEVTMACTRGKRLDCGCSVAARQKRRELLRLVRDTDFSE